MKLVTHIVPYFAPTIDGVGDYALILGRHLRATHGWDSRFVVCDPDWNGPEKVDGFAVEKIADRSADHIAGVIDVSETILLHYVGYGYQARGVPIWLAEGILGKPRRMTTVFHEIWSKGPPWKSVFYLSGTQKQLVEDFLAVSQRAFASTLEAVRSLEKIKDGRTAWLPIPSNLPASPASSRRSEKGWKFLIFGQPPMRARATQRHAKLLSALHARGDLEEIVVAGKEARRESEEVGALEEFLPAAMVRVMGEVADAGVFSTVDAYLSPHRACDACKSGALMAALAAGCPAIVADESDPSPLRIGQELWMASAEQLNKEAVARVGAAGRDWYLKNADWPIVAARIAEGL